MSYSFEQRKRAVELYIRYDKSVAAVRSELGYPSRQALYNWYRDYLEHGFRPDYRPHAKYSEEQKKAAVNHYLSHGRRISATRRALGYPARKGLLAEWIDGYAPGERRVRAAQGVFTSEQKARAVADLELRTGSGEDVAAAHGMNRGTIYKWRSKMLGTGPTGSKVGEPVTNDPAQLAERVADLQDQVRRLELEKAILEGTIEIIKKDQGADPKRLTNREKTLLIEELRSAGWPLATLLGALAIKKSSYYYQVGAMAAAGTDDADDAVQAVFRESDGRYGRRRIHDELAAEGVIVGERRISAIMKRKGLVAKGSKRRKRGYSSYRGEVSEHPGNRVNRDFRSALPNALWLTDVTQFTIPAGKVYLSPVIDCFDGLVVSWTASANPDAKMANTMLRSAISTLSPGETPVLHTDCGVHYRWPEWISICEGAGIVRSMSAKGCSPDNSAMEGFFGRMKNEMFYDRDWRDFTMEEFMEEVADYIDWYNTRRRKRSLGGVSPLEFRKSLGLTA